MARNKTRKSKPAGKTAKPVSEAAAQKNAAKEVAAEVPVNEAPAAGAGIAADADAKKAPKQKKPQETLYQVKTKRTADILKAYITFTYRVMHPKVSARLVFYGILVVLPGIFFFKDLYWKLFFIAVGAAMILLGFFRQYISLAMTKKNDPDYINGTEFTYNFNINDGEFLRNGEYYSGLGKYKSIAGFYYDRDHLYMSLTNKELIVIPKNAFTIGDADSFEDFIYKKSKKTCHWLPDNFRDQWKKRRAGRAAASNSLK